MRAFLIKLILRAFSFLPLSWVHNIATKIGRILLYFPQLRLINVMRINLQLCYPQLDQKELLKHSIIETCKTFTELGALWLWSSDRTLTLIQQVTGEYHLQQALQHKKGVILLTPHFGAWELAGLYASAHYRMTALYRPPKLSGLQAFILAARQRAGGRYVAIDQVGIRALYQTLKQGNVVGILPDQVPAQVSAGQFAPFFGIMANTMTLVSRLQRKTEARVIFTYAVRLPQGQGFHLYFLPAPNAIYASDPIESVQALNQGVEQCIQSCPTQYQWSYKRFKQRLAHEPNLY